MLLFLLVYNQCQKSVSIRHVKPGAHTGLGNERTYTYV